MQARAVLAYIDFYKKHLQNNVRECKKRLRARVTHTLPSKLARHAPAQEATKVFDTFPWLLLAFPLSTWVFLLPVFLAWLVFSL